MCIDNSGLLSLMPGGCEKNEGDEGVAVNCAPCTTALDLIGLLVDRLTDVGEGTVNARNCRLHFSFTFLMMCFFKRCLCFTNSSCKQL